MTDIDQILLRQREAFLAARPEPLSVRRDRLKRLAAMMRTHGETFAAAMRQDFGGRATAQSKLTDIAPVLSTIAYCLKNLDSWTRPDKRSATFPLGLLGGRAEVRYVPLGVVGIVSPWNFPVNLTFAPAAQAMAAGNRVMIKPSEYTEATSALMAELVAEYFQVDELAVAIGGADVAERFTGLKFDHLMFTGSTATGRIVAQAAAKNLVPCTLELGGKSPAIIGRSANLAKAAERIVLGKMLNAGQTCIAPDYLFVPADKDDALVRELAASASRMYPTLTDNEDYAAVINDHHHARLAALVDDATANGAEAIVVNPAGEDFAASNTRKMPLTILRGVTSSMKVMQQEIFGPILPVMTFNAVAEAIDHVNANDRPLALYYFGSDDGEREQVLSRTISGGVTINDVVFHFSQDALPFGGVGASGIGAYHGPEGFRTFSHARSIYRQSRFDVAKLAGLKPPYGKATARALKLLLK